MSWFGETFGDSLSSLKGQITKITKVLADDEFDKTDDKEIVILSNEELEALCESKDVTSIRNEFDRLHNQYKSKLKFLKSENEKLKATSDMGKTHEQTESQQSQPLNELENEIQQLREEKNHLNYCLDALQVEHQMNLNEVILIRDKYKEDLDELKKEYDTMKENFNKLTKLTENVDLSNKENLKEPQLEDVNLMKSEIERLCLQIEDVEKEKKNLIIALEKEKECHTELKRELEKLVDDKKLLSKDKQKIEEENNVLKSENSDLKNKLSAMEKKLNDIQGKIANLKKENEEFTQRLQTQENFQLEVSNVTKCHLEAQSKLSDILKLFDIAVDKDLSERNFINALDLFENKLKNYQKDKEQALEQQKMVICNLDSECKKLIEENSNLHQDIKMSTNKWEESEKKYLEEIGDLKNIVLELKTQQQNCINESETDDVKRLKQEVAHLMSLVQTKNNEIMVCSKSKSVLEQDFCILKSLSAKTELELCEMTKEIDKLNEEVKLLKKGEMDGALERNKLMEKIKTAETCNAGLNEINVDLKNKIIDLEKELSGMKIIKTDLDNKYTVLQKTNNDLQNDLENFKAQVVDLKNVINSFKTEELENKILNQTKEIENLESEIKRWREISVDLEVQRQNLIKKNEDVEKECIRLKSQLDILPANSLQVIQNNTNLLESNNEENKIPGEVTQIVGVNNDSMLISELREENIELKSRIQKFQEQMKAYVINPQNQQISKSDMQQHRRTRSEVDFESAQMVETQQTAHENNQVGLLQKTLLEEQAKHRLLQQQYQEIFEKEANARKEFERLKQHLIEVEDHYTEEAIKNEKIINDLKSKIIAAEEQLKNSSTLYTSAKIRDNQHLESLQSQIRMVSAQRDDLQTKLSTAEDEVQKHKASLMSLQIVLEQFQQDKEHEIEGVVMKYENQLQMTYKQFGDFQIEIDELKKQLNEAKNGLKAASRLGEQLEKKTQQVTELEENLKLLNSKVIELESNLAAANQVNSGKVDQSLVKNLVVGYILSPNTDRKSQVLRIMASVLDFSQDERNKIGIDSSNSGWLSNILHPKARASPNDESLSEAFIKFLESESRPQPQLKLNPEDLEIKKAKPMSSSPKPSLFSELMLPTFNSSQDSESSVILKNVLKDS